MKLSKQVLIALGVASAGILPAKDLTREQLDKMLEETAKNPVTSALHPGAACYAPVPLPLRIEYVCPLCKAKTLHAEWKNVNRVQQADRFRQQMKRIKQLHLDAALDETDLCSHCRRDKDTDTVEFHIVVWVNERAVRTVLEWADLSKLIAFLERKDVWDGGAGGTRPLKDELPRIRTILGEGATTPTTL